jgi:hypothetical protein
MKRIRGRRVTEASEQNNCYGAAEWHQAIADVLGHDAS